MRVFSLAINGKTVAEIDCSCPDWLPVRPRINRRWLRVMLAEAVRAYYQGSTVVRA